MRAFACDDSNTYILERLQEFLEESRVIYEQIHAQKKKSVNSKATFSYFAIGFLRYCNFILTKINLEKIEPAADGMLLYFSNYLSGVTKHKQIDQAGKLLKMIIIMMIFLLYHSIEGFQDATQPKSKFQRTIDQMANNFAAKICLKYSFGLIFQLIKFIMQNFQDEALNLLCPIFYFFAGYPNIAGYIFENFSNFLPMIKGLQTLLQQKFTEYYKNLNMSEDNLNQIFKTELLSSDKDLLGFIPLNAFFTAYKTSFKMNLQSSEQQSLIKMYALLEILQKFNNYLKNISEQEDLNFQEQIQKQSKEHKLEQAFQEDDKANLPDKSKILIVIDGQNVAMRHGEMNQQFSSKVKKQLKQFYEQGT